MAKELPYFRFTVQDWQNGKISLESFELQGLFISVCGYYWINDCSITLAMLQKKFTHYTNLVKELIELEIIKHENKHDKIEIDFLNLQYDLLSEKRKLRQSAGSKGGNAKAMLKQKFSYKDKDKDKDKENNKDKDNFKEIDFKNIKITDLEFEKLVNEFSEIVTWDAIKFLSDYKIEKNYKTKSDNLTIRRWVIEAVTKNKQYNGKQNDFNERKASINELSKLATGVLQGFKLKDNTGGS